jgi:hypothetical protein
MEVKMLGTWGQSYQPRRKYMQKTETSLFDLMVRKLQLTGKSERTQEAYARDVGQLRDYYQKNPA